MALIPAICPNCGAVLSINEGGKAEICEHCGSAFIVDEAVQNFNNKFISVNNTVNNIQANNVILEQGDPTYIADLQLLRSEVNKSRNKPLIGYNDYKTIDQIIPYGVKEKMDIYFDKPEYLYNLALLKYYNTIKSFFICNDKGWIEDFNKAIDYTADMNRKQALAAELNTLMAGQNEELVKRNACKEEFGYTIKNNPSALHKKCLLRHCIRKEEDELGFFYFFEGVLYLFGANAGMLSGGGLHPVTNEDGFMDRSKNANEKPRNFTFIDHGVFVYERYDYADEDGYYYISVDSINDLSMVFENNKIIDCTAFLGKSRYFHKWELSMDNIDQVMPEIIRFSSDRCFRCGAPGRWTWLGDAPKPCSICGYKIKLKGLEVIFK